MKNNNTPIRQNGERVGGVNDSSKKVENKHSGLGKNFRVQWSQDNGRLTRMGGLSYFANYLRATGLFEDLVNRCPLSYRSNNAPDKRDVLGTMLLSVLEGQTRYAHMASLAKGQLDAQALGMKKIPSEDSVRGALIKLVDTRTALKGTREWLDGCFDRLCDGCLEVPWVLDVDVTVKPLYGKQEGAVLGYNPTKPGRPSHSYHSFWVGHLRLCLGVEVRPGNETSGSFGLNSLMEWLDRMPRRLWPEFARGDIGYGTQRWMEQLESRDLNYLFKLRQSPNVKKLVAWCELTSSWESLSGGWQCCESSLELTGWDRKRRVVLYRRRHKRKVRSKNKTMLLCGSCEQLELLPLEVVGEGEIVYEYAIYVTTLTCPAGQIRAHYNPRGDNENCYDELKNQWGWGGFTLRDLPRSELMARFIALVYNWWSVYAKFVDPEVAREAVTSRPMYLMHAAKVHTHQSIRTLVVFCVHSQADRIRERLEQAAKRLKKWIRSATAEQLRKTSVWACVIAHILRHHQTIGAGNNRAPPALTTVN